MRLKDLLHESGILYKAGVKKYGKEGMTKIQSAAGKGENHEKIGKIKDKYEKGRTNEADEDNINEEYVESMDSVRLDKHLGEIEKLWKAWKNGPMTERSDIVPAGKELTHYILLWMRKTFK